MNKIERKSNFELLRIVSIFLIIMHHFSLNSNFEYQMNTFEDIYSKALRIFGKLGVFIFVIISGYFYEKNNVNIKKIIKFIVKICFFSIFGLLMGLLFNS